jgi:Mn2+/Fe2+ NRAMP family transporter
MSRFFFSFPAIVMNIGADIEGMGEVANLMVPSVSPSYFSIGFTFVLLICIIYFPYRKIAAILKYLTIVLFVYLIVPFIAKTDWVAAAKATFIPHISFDKEYLGILVAILGTTISPYLFFWQTTMEVEELEHKQKNGRVIVVSNRMFSMMRQDINIGMLLSNLIMYFIILTAGSVLAKAGVHNINTVRDAAEALKPLAGNAAYFLFAFGILGTGLLAIPVLSGSLSYIVSETFNWQRGLDKKFHEAPGFYFIMVISLIAGLMMNYVGFGAIKALIYSAMLYGLTAPVLIAIILLICNNKEIMGARVNGARANILGVATFFLMALSAIALLYFQFTT